MSGPAMMFLHRLAVGDMLGGGKERSWRNWALVPLLPWRYWAPCRPFLLSALSGLSFSEQTGLGARSEPRGRTIKIKMRKRPRADTKEPPGKCQVWSGINEHILAESLRVQIMC